MSDLNPKQELFVQEYLKDFNATQAAIRAGYSETTAYSIGSENLKKPEIQAAIDIGKKSIALRNEINQDFVLKELKEIASTYVEKLTGGDKLKALELLGKYLDMWDKKAQQDDGNIAKLIDVLSKPLLGKQEPEEE